MVMRSAQDFQWGETEEIQNSADETRVYWEIKETTNSHGEGTKNDFISFLSRAIPRKANPFGMEKLNINTFGRASGVEKFNQHH